MLQKEKNVEVENQNQKNKNMSKYNLTDILEQYRIGSGFTTDFDYEGMLKAGLETGVDTDIKILKAIFEDFTDVNYRREASHLYKAIEALEDGQPIDEISMLFGDFHAEIRNTLETFDMGIPDTLGGFMDSYIKEDYKPSHRAYNVIDGKGNIVYKELPRHTAVQKASEREDYKFTATDRLAEDAKAVDLAIEASQEKAGIKENKIKMMDDNHLMKLVRKNNVEAAEELAARDYLDDEDVIKVKNGGGKDLANTLMHSLISRRDNKKKRMNEVRIDREVANRIEGFLNIPMKAKFLDAWEDLFYDLVDDEPFFVDDVIAHLSNEMFKRINGNQVAGDRLAGIDDSEQEEFTAIPEGDSIEEAKYTLDSISQEEYGKNYDDLDPEQQRYMRSELEITKGYPFSAGIDQDGYRLPEFSDLMKNMKEDKGVDFIRALKVDANGTSLEIKSYLESLKRSGDKFDSVDDYVEDFKNYVADKALQEHFKRFI